jgi:RNA polymerase sigma factor (sigma-70 family)
MKDEAPGNGSGATGKVCPMCGLSVLCVSCKRRRRRKTGGARPPSIPGRTGSFRERLGWRWIRARVLAWDVRERDADDVVQEVVIAAAEAIQKAEHESGLRAAELPRETRRALLRAMVRRQVVHYRNVYGRGPEMEACQPSENVPDTALNVEEQALANTDTLRLCDALAELRETAPAYHALVVAFAIDELPMEDVAAALGIPKKAAWNRLRLGWDALRKILRRKAR